MDVDGCSVGKCGLFIFCFALAFRVWVCVGVAFDCFWRGWEKGFGEAEGGAERGLWWEESAGGDQAEGAVGVGGREVGADVKMCESLGCGCARGGDRDGEVGDWKGEANDEGDGRCHRRRQGVGYRCGREAASVDERRRLITDWTVHTLGIDK